MDAALGGRPGASSPSCLELIQLEDEISPSVFQGKTECNSL